MINDINTGIQNHLALYSQDILVYANVTTNPNGSLTVSSLTVDNSNTGITVSVIDVTFKVSGDSTPCVVDACVSSAPYAYEVQPKLGLYSSDIKAPGVGTITQPLSIQTVKLTPSGYPNNPNNTFTKEFTIRVTLGNSLTGDKFLPISITIQP